MYLRCAYFASVNPLLFSIGVEFECTNVPWEPKMLIGLRHASIDFVTVIGVGSLIDGSQNTVWPNVWPKTAVDAHALLAFDDYVFISLKLIACRICVFLSGLF